MIAGDLELEEAKTGWPLSTFKQAFGLVDAPIDTAHRRLHSWALAATAGTNMLRIGDTLYSWDARPRAQKNGALIGRVHAKRREQLTRDIGGYKIDAAGQVLQLPAALRGVLPGAEGAEESTDATNEGEQA